MAYIPVKAGGRFLAVSGDSMTGPLALNADPVSATGASTKQYIDPLLIDNNFWRPKDNPGVIAWNFDPIYCGNVRPTAGVIYLTRIRLHKNTTLTGFRLIVNAGGSYTVGQNWGALYNSIGAKVAATSELTNAIIGSYTWKNIPFTAPYVAVAGVYYVAFVFNNGAPSLDNTSSIVSNSNIVAPGMSNIFGTGQTTLPSSITLSSTTLSNTIFWVGLY